MGSKQHPAILLVRHPPPLRLLQGTERCSQQSLLQTWPNDGEWFMVIPMARLGLGFSGATESVSTHPPASRFQIVLNVSSAVLHIFGSICLLVSHLL